MPYRLSGECPLCKSYVVTRHRRADGEKFLSCSAYPDCRWAGDYDEALHELADSFAKKIVEVERRGGDRGRIADALRKVIALAHPDKFPEDARAQATEVTAALNALRGSLSE